MTQPWRAARRTAKRAIRLGRRLVTPTLAEGALFDLVVKSYCHGVGLEVGPGVRPYAPPGSFFIDQAYERLGHPVNVDAIGHAEQLPVRADSLDYLISSHCLEHCADTLTTLEDWRRTLRIDGTLILVLPHGERTWDRGRQLSTFDHHLAEQHRIDPLDDAHWSEFEDIAVANHHHYWSSDPEMKLPDGSWNRAALLAKGRIHYHVWTQHQIADILLRLGFRLLTLVEELPDRRDSFLAVAAKTAGEP